MKQIVILFVALLAQSLNAAGDNYNKGVISPNNGPIWREALHFKEAPQMKTNQKQIVVRPIGETNITSSTNLEIGKNYYLFEVVQAEDSSLLGRQVVCKVIERRKSNLSGSEGRLILRPLYLEKDSLQIPLVSDVIYRRGLNRSNVKRWLSFLIVPCFIAGSGAEISQDEEIVLTLE